MNRIDGLMNKKIRKTADRAKTRQRYKSKEYLAIKEPKNDEEAGKVPEGGRYTMMLWNWWRNFWAISGPLIALAGLWFNLTPSLSVYAGVNIDQSQMYSHR